MIHAQRESRRAATTIGILFACLCVVYLSGCSGQSSGATDSSASHRQLPCKLTVEIGTVESRKLAAEAEFTGNLLPRRRTSITAEVEGIVKDVAAIGPAIEMDVDGKHYSEQLGILPGQEVRGGDVLVRIDPIVFELDVAVAEAKLAKAKADLAKLMAGDRPEAIERLEALLAESKARYELAAADHKRIAAVATRGAISRSELERAAMEAATSHAAVLSQQAALRQSKAGPTAEEIAVQQALVQQAEAELRQKERLLEKTNIVAPYDGVITEVHVEEGDHVNTSSGPLLELLDLRYLVAEVGVPEAYLGDVEFQGQANVLVAGMVEPVPGLVIGINDKVDPQSRSFRVRVAIDNAAGRFKAGQFAHVAFNLGGHQETVTVPSRAITFVEGQPGVFMHQDGIARWRNIALGMSNETNTEVLSGLKPGDGIVVDDPNLLTDGMQVDVAGQ